jgi:putative peptide zinc metalloprotease protein
LIVHETVLDGEPIIGVLKRGKNAYFRLSPAQWDLIQLFDGQRSYEEISEAFASQHGGEISVDEARGFASAMDGSGLWYESLQEKNLAMREKLLAQRGRRKKAKLNIAHISFSAWDPDRYFDWLDKAAGRFIYSRWSLLLVVILFTAETAMVISNWNTIGPDTAQVFNFTQKSFADFARFWILIFLIGFVHETAHGLTCKHYGGQVHSMGLMFLYLTPCFFVDVTESWVSATKLQRLATIIAGIWIELVMCGIAMIFWLHAPAGSWFHTTMYELILLTGIAAVVINLNPLLKLDGYYFLTEIVEIPELKERSSAFVMAWIQAKILRLPVDVPIVPRRRVVLFVIYAVLSAAYSYLLLFFVLRFAYRLAFTWFGEFALPLALALGIFIFRSRLKALGGALKESWRNAVKDGFRWRPIHAVAATIIVALLFVPAWRDRVSVYFVIEPAESRTVAAAVPGQVDAVFVQEGQAVRAGQPLLRMTSIQAASMRSDALARSRQARFQSFDAQMQGQSIRSAAADQAEAQRMTNLANEAVSSLMLTAPADGTVLTQNPAKLAHENVGSGEPLLRLAEGARVVRVFIPATLLAKVLPDSEVGVALPGEFAPLRLRLASIEGEAVELPPGVMTTEKYKGLQLPIFYSSVIPLPSAGGDPLFGLAGKAVIFGRRRSAVAHVANSVSEFVKAHVWW